MENKNSADQLYQPPVLFSASHSHLGVLLFQPDKFIEFCYYF